MSVLCIASPLPRRFANLAGLRFFALRSTAHFWQSKENPDIGGRAAIVPSGGCLGGGSRWVITFQAFRTPSERRDQARAILTSLASPNQSRSINFLMYTRASASDYDDWETEGWSFNDILPLARKMETHHLTEGQNPKVHGKEGPLHVSYGGHQSELGKQFIKATEESNYEIPFTQDLQDFKTGHGITPWAKVSRSTFSSPHRLCSPP